MMDGIDRKHLLPSTLALCISFFSIPPSVAQVVLPSRSTQAAATPLPSNLSQAIVKTAMRRVRAAADQLQFYLNRPRKIDDLHWLGASILMNEGMHEMPCASSLESATRAAK